MDTLQPVLSPMEKLLGTRLTRESLAHVLGLSTIFSLSGAILLERLGMRATSIGPIAFVACLLLPLGTLYIVWPFLRAQMIRASSARGFPHVIPGFRHYLGVLMRIIEKPQLLGHRFGSRPSRSTPLIKKNLSSTDRRRQNLRAENDPRLSTAIFAANVPTFILDTDQRFVDWNPAFALAFQSVPGLKRGSHISRWYKFLDNFKRVPKRSDQLHGEALLPMADRERVAYHASDWGRMVFVKIMTPILDRKRGKIIGWTVVLNINSVNRRLEFFEALYEAIAIDTRKRFYAACYDGVFGSNSTHRDLIAAHTANLGSAKHILDLGSWTGNLACRLAREGRYVTAVEGDTHLLRRISDKTATFQSRVRIVKQPISSLHNLPAQRFDGVTMLLTANRLLDLMTTLKQVRGTMRPGGILTLSAIVPPSSVEAVFNNIRQEMTATGQFDALKDQFNHVLEHERLESNGLPYQYRSIPELIRIAELSGFTIEKELPYRLAPDQGEGLILLVLKN